MAMTNTHAIPSKKARKESVFIAAVRPINNPINAAIGVA
jgi:hypothetical protein